MRQFGLSIHLYANDNSAELPSGLSENFDTNDEHIPVMSRETRSALLEYARTHHIFECPGLMRPFNTQEGWYYPDYGFVLGYNYLGGHKGTRWTPEPGFDTWTSPQTMHDNPSMVLLTDLNDWAPGYGKAFAPHTPNGPVIRNDEMGTSADGAAPTDIGAIGGNIGLMDGSVKWKNIREMKLYPGSRMWGLNGCLAVW